MDSRMKADLDAHITRDDDQEDTISDLQYILDAMSDPKHDEVFAFEELRDRIGYTEANQLWHQALDLYGMSHTITRGSLEEDEG